MQRLKEAAEHARKKFDAGNTVVILRVGVEGVLICHRRKTVMVSWVEIEQANFNVLVHRIDAVVETTNTRRRSGQVGTYGT